MSKPTPPGRIRCGPPRSALWAIVALVALVVSSCGGDSHEAALPPPPQVVKVQMGEYAFAYDRSIRPGRTVFRVHSSGRRTHELVLIPLAEDFPPLDKQFRSKTGRLIAPLGRVRPLKPGRSGSFAVDLAPGRYGMASLVDDSDGTSDARKGMTSEFRVG